MTQMRVRSASWVLAAQVFGKLVAFPIGILLARSLGAEGKGAFSVLQLVTQFAVVLLGLGTSSSFLFLAGRRELRGCDALRLSVVFGAAATGLMLGAYVLVGPEAVHSLLNLTSGRLLLVSVLLVGPAIVSNFMYSTVFGSGSVRVATMVSNTSLALQLLAYAGLFFSGALTIASAIAVWGLSVVGEAVSVSIMGRGVRARDDVEPGVAALFSRGVRYGLMMWMAGLVGQAALRIDMFLLSAQKGTAAVGIYSVAVTFAELLWFIPTALNAVMLPKVSGEGRGALDVTLRLQRVLWPVTLLTGVLVALGAWVVIPLLYGKEFSGSIVPLVLLMPGALALALTTMPSAYLSGVGLPEEWTKASITNLVANVAANIVLIPRFGVAGAAMASAVSYSVAAVLIVRSFVRHTGIRYRDALLPTRDDFDELFAAVSRVLASVRSHSGEA